MIKLQAVIFDLDGVITDTAKYHYEAWKRMAQRIGITIDAEFNESLKGISRMQSLERILIHGKREQDFSQEEKASLAKEKNDHYVSLLAGLTPEDTFPGITKLLEELKEHQVPSIIASASRNAPLILHSLQLEKYFQAVIDPEGVLGKPAPDLFLRGAEFAGADPANCIGIEDSQAGIEAIKMAGMYAVGIGEERLLAPYGPDKVYTSTHEVKLSSLLQAASMV